MERYANRSGNSEIVAYEMAPGSITVEYKGGALYRYDHIIPGSAHIARMQALAQSGLGLCSYISSVVKKRYARKLK